MAAKLFNMRIFIHIGSYKTGTTSIQSHLQRSRDKLEASGWLYPLSGSQNGHAHHQIPFALQKSGGGDSVDASRSLVSEIIEEAKSKKAENIVISSEVFFSLQNSHIQSFSKLFEGQGHDVRIVCYLRRQDQFLHSFYMQCIKHSQMRVSDEPAEYKGFNEVVSIARYDQIISWWAEAFGKDAMMIETYDSKCQKNGVVNEFMQKIECDAAPSNNNEARINTTIRTELIEYLRVANSIGISPDQHELLLKNLNSLSVQAGDHFTNHKYITVEDGKRICSLYGDINSTVLSQWFSDRETLFDVALDSSTTIQRQPELRPESVARISAWLWFQSQEV